MRITESQIRQIIRQEVKRVIVEGGHDTYSVGDSTPYQEAVQDFANALAKNRKFGPGDDEYEAYNLLLRGGAAAALRDARELYSDRGDNIPHDYSGRGKLSEKDSAYDDDTYEPVDENHRPSNRSQMMFPLHALRESKLRLRRPS